MTTINLETLTKGEARNLTGQERGVAARQLFELEKLDQAGEIVEIIVPANLDAIATSFFQGMFANSVRRYGDAEFLKHYKFNARPEIMTQIFRGIERVKTQRGLALAD